MFAALYDADERLVAHFYGPESALTAKYFADAVEMADGADDEDFEAFRKMRDGLRAKDDGRT